MILAHAFGQRYELPIPLLLFVLGGAVVVLASFVLVVSRPVDSGSAWDESPDRPAGKPLGRVGPAVSLLLLALLVACGMFGSQEVSENLLPTVMWLLVWIAVPLSCGLVGDWTQPVNPFANLALLADDARLRRWLIGSPDPVRWPRWLGWWPAVVLYFVAACGELIFNETATLPRVTAVALLVYAVLSAFCGMVFGRAWVERGEMFSVLFSTWGRLGYFRFGAEGRRGFAGGLEAPFAGSASRVAFVLLLLISVNFDGLLATPQWTRLEHRLPGGVAVHAASHDTFRVAAFVLLALLIGLVFGAFARAARRVGDPGSGGRGGLVGLLPSLLPIAFGYLLAHNIEYVLVNGQLLFPLLGNPIGKGSWPIHLPYPFNDDFDPNPHLLPSAFYWYLAVVVIVAVHVIAVILAHHRLARAGADRRLARRSEYPWLLAMVAYTMLSLWLLAQPLVKEANGSGGSSALPAPSSHAEQVVVQ